MPLLPELKNILECVSTKMPPLTGLDGGGRNPKVIWTEVNGKIQLRATNEQSVNECRRDKSLARLATEMYDWNFQRAGHVSVWLVMPQGCCHGSLITGH
jgi:hypothetical protein